MRLNHASWPKNVFILIPSYKASGSLSDVLSRLTETVPPDAVCIVDDASMDGTDSICARFDVSYVAHATNKGKGAALTTGFKHLLNTHNPSWIITMDADGQHAIEDLDAFLSWATSSKQGGICIGTRLKTLAKMPAARIVSNALTSLILSLLTGRRIPDSQCGFRMYSADLLRRITCEYPRFEMESEIILKAAFLKFPISSIPVQTLYLNGQSHIEHVRDTLRWVRSVLVVWWKLRMQPTHKV